ncbi:yippee-like 4 [Sigmodon hispidus]
MSPPPPICSLSGCGSSAASTSLYLITSAVSCQSSRLLALLPPPPQPPTVQPQLGVKESSSSSQLSPLVLVANLLRCFTCDRLCGGCTAPAPPARQGIVLQPVMPSCDPGPAPACLPTKTFRSYLPRCHRTYSCVHCRAHLAKHDELISKSFQGSHGRAYLFNSVVNVGCGPAEQRLLLTGLHSVADIFCESCKTTLGWKYEQAFETSQKYKEGKYIIEMSHMVKDNGWD